MADNANLPPTWATTAGLGFLTLNSRVAIYRVWGDLVSILLVTGSYAALLLLFRCLRDYERAAPGSQPERGRGAVWLLTVAFAWKVAAAMPSAAASAVIWALAVGALRPWIGMRMDCNIP
uniref:Uncharacterized protein n=2 Tax=Zea mays TaxID=4577 RepID=A0A804PUH0_MAIZE